MKLGNYNNINKCYLKLIIVKAVQIVEVKNNVCRSDLGE